MRNPFALLDPLRHHELSELPYEVPVQFLEHRIEQDQILYTIAHEQQCGDFQYLRRLECTYRKYLDGLKSITELCEEPLPFAKRLPNQECAELDFQRKIEISTIASDCGPELIVLASLVDSAANLGGIARTCEIFGAQLVLGSLEVCSN